MKFFLISDNVDTKMGMRFAGIEGVVVHQEDGVRSELEKAYYGNTCFALSRPYL